MRIEWKKDAFRIVMISCAALVMALNINTFVHTGGLYPGGATGLTVLIQRSAAIFLHVNLPYTVINLLINFIPIYIGFRFIGKKFTLFSCYFIVLTSILTDLIPSYVITYDVLLISVFGGIINGAVISTCLMLNGTTGGTDFLAIFLSERKGVDSWNVVLVFNTILLLAAGWLFGWDKALYSIIFQFTSTQVVHLLYRRYQQQTLFIVTEKAEEICQAISNISMHGATVLHGEGAYQHTDRAIVYSVVSRDESKKIINAVQGIDPQAFINSIRTEQLAGRFYRTPKE
ncbi:MAG: YitT family protein [Blautia sp.]|nr:YitT family protein [Blautia sp.]